MRKFIRCDQKYWAVLAALATIGLLSTLSACQVGEKFRAFAISSTPTSTGTLTSTVTGTFTPTLTLTSPSETPIPSDSPIPPTDTASPTGTTTQTLEPSLTYTITPGPSPTATRRPTSTRWPTLTRGPTPTRTITPTPTVTNTPTPPKDQLRIQRPGLFSKVKSPIRIEAYVEAGDDGFVNLDLIGEDGRTITKMQTDFRNYVNKRVALYEQMNFDITAAAETARLILSINDLYGRKKNVSSVDLILLKVGSDEITPTIIGLEPYLIRYPYEKQEITGGNLLVVGLARPVNNNPLIIELIDEDGKVVASTKTQVAPPSGDLSHTPFQLDIPYSVTEDTPVRLTIRQESDQRIPGTVALNSIEIILKP